MGLFSKKEPCCICGNPNAKEKLANGWICFNCIKKSGGFLSGDETFKDVTKEKVLRCTEEHEKNLELLAQFNPTKKIKDFLYIDETKRQWLVPDKIKDPIVMSYDDIISVSIQKNGNTVTSGGIAEAAAGGMLFGTPGAIVGASIGKKTSQEVISTLFLIITTRNKRLPQVYIFLHNKGTISEGTTAYNYLLLDMERILSEISIMQADANARPQNTSNTLSDADEILKYKKLFDEGIITQEEFEAKKKLLLGL